MTAEIAMKVNKVAFERREDMLKPYGGYYKDVFVPAVKKNNVYCVFYGKEDFRRLWRGEPWLCTWRTTGRLLDTVVKTK